MIGIKLAKALAKELDHRLALRTLFCYAPLPIRILDSLPVVGAVLAIARYPHEPPRGTLTVDAG